MTCCVVLHAFLVLVRVCKHAHRTPGALLDLYCLHSLPCVKSNDHTCKNHNTHPIACSTTGITKKQKQYDTMLPATRLVSGGKLSFLFWFVFANTVNTVWDLRCQHALPCVNSNQHTCTHHHTNLITRSTTGLKTKQNVTLCFPQRVFWVVANCWCNLWGSESPHATSTNQKSTRALS